AADPKLDGAGRLGAADRPDPIENYPGRADRAARPAVAGPADRSERQDERRLQADPKGGERGGGGSHSGRNRLRKRAGGAGGPPPQRPLPRAVYYPRLQRDSEGADRIGALRPRKRGVHYRGLPAKGGFRAGARR